LAPGQIYGCNRQGVLAAGQKLGFEMVDLGHMPDDPQVIAAGLQAAAVQCDVLLTSGGVSVGEEDHVRPVVQAHGDLLFWRLAIKPGKPIAIGHVFGRPFIGLPGNPVSSMITFQLIAAPILRAYAGGGAAQWQPQAFAMMAGADIRKAPGRQEFQRAFLRETGDGLRVFTTPTNGQIGGSTLQASHMLAALAAADGVIDLAADCAGVAAGEIVPFIPFA
jgi:molybdopterin molybdotransferase